MKKEFELACKHEYPAENIARVLRQFNTTVYQEKITEELYDKLKSALQPFSDSGIVTGYARTLKAPGSQGYGEVFLSIPSAVLEKLVLSKNSIVPPNHHSQLNIGQKPGG